MSFKMLILILSLDICPIYGEVVELVYGTSLENWRALIAYRGFESHPLRQNKVRYFFSFPEYLTFIYKMEMYPSGEGDCLLNS